MRSLLVLTIVLTPTTAAAQELGVTANAERPIASTGGEDPTASATTVDAQDRPRADEDLADALLEVPGARPLRTGAYGSPATLSLRGADADQTEVLLGELPLTTVDGSAFDLSSFPLWALDRIEVYRGGAPTWLGAQGIGGVLRLVPRRAGGDAFRATGGAGSFGLVHGRLAAGTAEGDVDWLTSAGVTRSDGDFPFTFDDTLLDEHGAEERRRTNAELTQASAIAHVRGRAGQDRFDGVALGMFRAGGVPTPAAEPADRARREEAQAIAAAGWEHVDSDWRLAASFGLAYRARGLEDLDAEINPVPQDAHDEALRTVLRVAARGDALDWLELIGVGLWAHEELLPEDSLARVEAPGSTRDVGTLGAEARMFGHTDGVRYELRPSVRLGLVGSRLSDLRPEMLGERTERFDAVPTLRLGGAIEPWRGVTFAASASSATRTPTAVELFGDRAFLRGNTDLTPERAERFDASVALRGRVDDLRGRAELRGFGTLASDLIRYRRSGVQVIAENVASAQMAGAELGLAGQLTPHFVVTGAATWLETWTEQRGQTRRLPYRPRLTAYLRVEGRAIAVGPVDRLVFFGDVVHVAEAFADPRQPHPDRRPDALRSRGLDRAVGAAGATRRRRARPVRRAGERPARLPVARSLGLRVALARAAVIGGERREHRAVLGGAPALDERVAPERVAAAVEVEPVGAVVLGREVARVHPVHVERRQDLALPARVPRDVVRRAARARALVEVRGRRTDPEDLAHAGGVSLLDDPAELTRVDGARVGVVVAAEADDEHVGLAGVAEHLREVASAAVAPGGPAATRERRERLGAQVLDARFERRAEALDVRVADHHDGRGVRLGIRSVRERRDSEEHGEGEGGERLHARREEHASCRPL